MVIKQNEKKLMTLVKKCLYATIFVMAINVCEARVYINIGIGEGYPDYCEPGFWYGDCGYGWGGFGGGWWHHHHHGGWGGGGGWHWHHGGGGWHFGGHHNGGGGGGHHHH